MQSLRKFAPAFLATPFLAGASAGQVSEVQSYEEAMVLSEELAVAHSRDITSITDFEMFKATVYKEDIPGGGYIVDGDTYIPSDELLLEFYFRALESKAVTPKFIINVYNGYEDIWDETQRQALTYCVSTEFGDQYDRVVTVMADAAAAWGAVANVNFVHDDRLDASCDRFSQAVLFDVRPVNLGRYLARAFFPNYRRNERNVLIDQSAMTYPDAGPGLTLTGILRHELGHVIGARHEHTRPESGTCFEDASWKPVTDYDPFSVMHYPQCNGLGDWTLTLTNLDKNGVACAYGPAPGFTLDTNICNRLTDGVSEITMFRGF